MSQVKALCVPTFSLQALNGLRHAFLAESEPEPEILIVDDDQAVLGALEFALAIEGFRVRSFNKGEALLNIDLPGHACLVVDYNMPDLDGLELLRRLRGKGVTLPAILMTATPTAHLRETASEIGVPVIEKPFFGNELTQGVRRLLEADAGREPNGNCAAT